MIGTKSLESLLNYLNLTKQFGHFLVLILRNFEVVASNRLGLMLSWTPSNCSFTGKRFRTSLRYTPSSVAPKTWRTMPRWSGNICSTKAFGHCFPNKFLSANNTKSPSWKLDYVCNHFWRYWSVDRYFFLSTSANTHLLEDELISICLWIGFIRRTILGMNMGFYAKEEFVFVSMLSNLADQ